MRDDVRPLLGAAIAAILFLILGFVVSRTPPGPFDLFVSGWRGAATPLAIVFTRSGYTPALLAVGAVGIAATLWLRAPLFTAMVVIAAQIASQSTAYLLKMVFERPRPDAWIFRQEAGLSYPSGHAVTAVVFYVGWAVLIWSWPLPRSVRLALVIALVLWALGIGWSRIALGAHFPTDVIGGYLYGTLWLCIVLAVLAFLRARHAA